MCVCVCVCVCVCDPAFKIKGNCYSALSCNTHTAMNPQPASNGTYSSSSNGDY